MIKFLIDYNGFVKGTKHDFGCVRNKLLVDRGVAAYIKVNDVKYSVK